MKSAIKVAGAVTLATLIICYCGIRRELTLAKRAPAAPMRLADATNAEAL